MWILEKNEELTIPKVDLIVGSPPCQGFSNEGKKIKNDPRNSLVWFFLEIVQRVQPEVWVFENVPGFKRSYGGHYYELMRDTLKSWDYTWNDYILNAADFGVPQKRKRFIIIASKNRLNPPEPTHSSQTNLLGTKPYITLWDAISDLPTPKLGDRLGQYDYNKEPMNDFQRCIRNDFKMINNHTAQKHSQRVIDKIKAVPIGGNMQDITYKFSENRIHYCGGYRRAIKERPSYTAYWTRGMTSIHPEQHRFLTPRECARIQSFPDKFKFYGSTIENYTMICNAVPPLLARAIAESIKLQLS